jgi:hypothetical protein
MLHMSIGPASIKNKYSGHANSKMLGVKTPLKGETIALASIIKTEWPSQRCECETKEELLCKVRDQERGRAIGNEQRYWLVGAPVGTCKHNSAPCHAWVG